MGDNPANRDALNATKLLEGARALSHKVSHLEESLADAFTPTITLKTEANGHTPSVRTVITATQRASLTANHSARVASSTLALQQYVRTECQCLSLLAHRVSQMATQMVHLKREFNAYKSLNMTALANDVEIAIKKMEADLSEDKKAIGHLQETLTDTMQRYGVCLNLSAPGMHRERTVLTTL